MDVYVSSKADRPDGVPKQSFQLKDPRKDGLVLQVHHTVPGLHGEIRRVRFVLVTFNDLGEELAACDHRGNIFVIDLAGCKFWLLVNLGSCSVLSFSPVNKTDLVVGTANGTLNIVNTEVGKTVGVLKGHASSVNKLSFAKKRFCLSSSSKEAIIWDLQSNSQVHRLNLRTDILLKQVFFMPVSDNILACFQDDAIHIWSFETFQCIKQIIPEAWKNHHVKTIAFTRNGRAMVLGGHTPSIIIFDLDNWKVKKVIEMPVGISGVRHLEFIPGLFDGGANKFLGILSEKCGMYFFNTEDQLFLPITGNLTSGLRIFTCSTPGKYLSFILHTGEINIYKSSKLIEMDCQQENNDFLTKEKPQTQNIRHDPSEYRQNVQRRQKSAAQHLQEVHREIQDTLDLQKLLPILKEFGEYPEAYRALIWKTILQLPYNKSSYVGLVNRDCNPAYLHLEEQYPLENRSILKNLKRLLSCLSHWCALFGEVKFLPLFVFPFVKVFQNDPFACFEAVATIIVNWCQHWFEYFPFPPVNVLAMIENVLAESDPELMHFYYKTGITSRVYAWPLLEVAFTEVLSVTEWKQLWDHVLSNEPAFLLMAVVAYNISCRSALQLCQNLDDFDHFFHNQNAIDMKRFISKTYSLCRKTSDDIHPRQYLQSFTPLPKDSYPAFNQYPKFIVDYQAEQLERIRKEEEEILHEQEEAEEQRLAQEHLMKEDMRKELQEARLLRLEGEYKKIVEKEEERLAVQRQKISALRRDLRARELELLDQARNKLSNQLTMKRSVVVDRLLNDIAHKREQDYNYLARAEEDLKSHLTEMLVQKQRLQMQIDKSLAETSPSIHHRLIQHQQAQLRKEISKLRQEAKQGQHSRLIDINAQLSALDARLKQAEVDLAKEMVEGQLNLINVERNSHISQLERTTKVLEEEVQNLLQKLAILHLAENQKTFRENKAVNPGRDITQQQHPAVHSHFKEQVSNDNFGNEMFDSLEMQNKCVTEGYNYQARNGAGFQERGNSRSPSYYQRQQNAVKSAMDIREQVLNSIKYKS
ncbi:hypothetical protein R5R35_005871 [Gryllus longicercus]|uniref:TBC1 domain family member 31 n=1 Tax=Gryllus longicercus TaxID=2509291 RepID=A0AAN9V780_9ORTH